MIVDVILITYNQEQYIKQSIDSILMQQLSEDVTMRIIVADDCSTDNTNAIIYSTLGDKAVYLPREKNMGHLRNYQRVFKVCNGDYVAILEGDDYWTDVYHLQTRIDFMESHKDCVLCTQRPVWYYEEEQRYEPFGVIDEGSPAEYISLEEEIRENRIINLSSCMVRTSAVHALDERIYACSVLDWPMYANLAQIGSLYVLPGSSSIYRAKSSGLYAGMNEQKEKDMDLRLIDEIEAIFPQYAKYYKEARMMVQSKKKTLRKRIGELIRRWRR